MTKENSEKVYLIISILLAFSLAINSIFLIDSRCKLQILETENKDLKTTCESLELENEYLVSEKLEDTQKRVGKMLITRDIPLDSSLQYYIRLICDEYKIDPDLIFAIIKVESGFKPNVVNSLGCYGLMQIRKDYHEKRMERLEISNLLDPYENALCGIDIIAEKINKYGNTSKALIAYNAGDIGAKENYFSKGIYSTSYSEKVLSEYEKIKEL